MNTIVAKWASVAVFAALAGATGAVSAADLVGHPAAARDKVAMCIGCHGIADYRTAFPEVYRVPLLGGQNAHYIENALYAYKKGDRKFGTMHAVAVSLSDQDIADIAAYYAAQTPTSTTNPAK
jgi:cytochrome c553